MECEDVYLRNCGAHGVDERRLHSAIAETSSIDPIYEIAFNTRHSTLLWIRANTRAQITSFDDCGYQYNDPGGDTPIQNVANVNDFQTQSLREEFENG